MASKDERQGFVCAETSPAIFQAPAVFCLVSHAAACVRPTSGGSPGSRIFAVNTLLPSRRRSSRGARLRRRGLGDRTWLQAMRGLARSSCVPPRFRLDCPDEQPQGQPPVSVCHGPSGQVVVDRLMAQLSELVYGICAATSACTYGYSRWIKAFKRSRSGASRALTPSALTSATMTSPTSSWTSLNRPCAFIFWAW